MALQASVTNDTTGVLIAGNQIHRSGQTIFRDAGRTAGDLLFLTLMSQRSSDLKWVPTTDVSTAYTSAKMVCGTNGGNLAAYQAVGDGSYKINVDGTLYSRTGLVFTAVVALTDVVGILKADAAGLYDVVYDALANVFTFVSLKTGLPASSITVLTAGAAGTDISGAGFLNGLTAVGTVTAATGGNGEDVPGGLLWGNDITEALIIAADVTNKNILTGESVQIDESKIVLENGLDLDDIITSTGKTIRATLGLQGITPRPTEYFQNIQPIA